MPSLSLLRFFFSSRRRHTRYIGDWSSDVCSSDLGKIPPPCPDATAAAKIAKAEQKKVEQIQKCPRLPPWWDVCPEDSQPPCDQTIGSIGDVITCVEIGRASCRERGGHERGAVET